MDFGIEIIFRIAAIGILITVVVQILKNAKRDEIATLVTIAGLIIVLVMVLQLVAQLFDSVRDLFELTVFWGKTFLD
ncbi:MAG: stage III sporulation protein AC [Firmicutes bacterium]|nr:stage III sporulation protein AC [Bacillota bacterium]